MCSWKGLLDFKSEKTVVFHLLSGQGSASPPFCYFGEPVHKGRALHKLGSICLLPQAHHPLPTLTDTSCPGPPGPCPHLPLPPPAVHTHTHTPGSSEPPTEAPGAPHSQGPGRQSPGRDTAWSYTRKFRLRAPLCGRPAGCLCLLVRLALSLLVAGEGIM